MSEFNKVFEITYRDVDSHDNMKLNILVDFMQDMARLHATELEVDFAHASAPYFWIVTKTSVILQKYPKLYDKITIKTSIQGLDSLYSVRRFDILDAKDQPIGEIIAYYILMDKSTHRPVRMKNADHKLSVYNFAYQGRKLKKLTLSNETALKSVTRRVFSSEIDSNKHMNNAHYLKWALDMFTTDELIERPVREIYIQYMHEMLEGDQIEMSLCKNEQDEFFAVGKNISSDNENFICKLVF
ncbi:MAG: thioesterase [Clostridia bacterium]